MSRYPRPVLWLLPLLLLLHQSYWLWGSRELLLGWPVNLLYHAALCTIMPLIMLAIVRHAWPDDLDQD